MISFLMKANEKKIRAMIAHIDRLTQSALDMERQYRDQISKVHPAFSLSARNLVHYRALRQFDLRPLQVALLELGVSRLAKAENHVLASLYALRSILLAFVEDRQIIPKAAPFSIKNGHKRMRKNTKALFGGRSRGRWTRIMVTLPSEAATDKKMVHGLLAGGTNCVRINCAHDGPEAWEKMILNVRTNARKLRKKCPVSMDLGGPKIRTGAMSPGPRVLKVRPVRNTLGEVIEPARIWLSPAPHPDGLFTHIPVPEEGVAALKKKGKWYFTDTRGKRRTIRISASAEHACMGELRKTAYFPSECRYYSDPEFKSKPLTGGVLPSTEAHILLFPGDILLLRKDPAPGQQALPEQEGSPESPAYISCTAPALFSSVRKGEPISFDDGKMTGKIQSVSADEIRIKIVSTSGNSGKLRADKGINLPETRLPIRGLTEKDKEDLSFVVAHADVVNMSFVNSVEDVDDLITAIRIYQDPVKIGVILKIETRAGFENLFDILMAGMQVYPLGVMVARGDLAIETGWENMARIQEEIMSVCRAAHVPDVWATQVLETLAKTGIPSRSEITDAAMAQRAECVMLNKGPEILGAIGLLDQILRDREHYMDKHAPLLPAMEKFPLILETE
jgi:pyruvate kinase